MEDRCRSPAKEIESSYPQARTMRVVAHEKSTDAIPECVLPDNAISQESDTTFSTKRQDEFATRILPESTYDSLETDMNISCAEAETMREVTHWAYAYQNDEFWTPENKTCRQVFPSIQQILDQMRNNHSPTDPRCGSTYAFEELLTAIALQMLASCYTTVPASSAHQFPLFQQRKEVQVITALSLHARHRFDPAAGHQARPPSETAALPGLYGGPTLEDELAERLSKRRRVDSRKSDFPHFSIENSWADGPSSAEAQSPPQRTHSRDSSRSSVDAGFFSRLICQPSMPKNPRRKQNTLFLSRLSLKRWRQKDPQTRDSDPQETQMRPLQHLTAQAMQRIPSTLRLRHTQSAPRITAKVSDAVTRPVQARRHSSNPSIGSPLAYPFELPDVRQTSVTPDPDRKLQDAMQGAVRGCGRGDLIAAHEDFAFPDSRQEYYMQRPALHASTQHDMPTETISPLAGPAVSPYVEVATSPATDYFSSVYANRVLPYHARTLSRAWEEQNDAGPDYEDDPRLQKMLGGILKEASESDASEIEKTKRGRRF